MDQFFTPSETLVPKIDDEEQLVFISDLPYWFISLSLTKIFIILSLKKSSTWFFYDYTKDTNQDRLSYIG
jgi:hypothetical protein